jgi:hypothetical protein
MKKNNNFSNYSLKNITIASIGSHSALDVARGAKDEGFKTLVITQKGRGEVYSNYYKTNGDLGCVDEVIELDTFKQILDPKIKQHLLEKNVIFVPNRSFEVYLNDYDAIEKDFTVPMFGNRMAQGMTSLIEEKFNFLSVMDALYQALPLERMIDWKVNHTVHFSSCQYLFLLDYFYGSISYPCILCRKKMYPLQLSPSGIPVVSGSTPCARCFFLKSSTSLSMPILAAVFFMQ